LDRLTPFHKSGPPRAGRLRTFADLNLLSVNMRQQLTEVAHVEPFSADRAIPEMISLSFGHAVRIEAV
jgi:hypothetical protein